jgi:hypothetical protein
MRGPQSASEWVQDLQAKSPRLDVIDQRYITDEIKSSVSDSIKTALEIHRRVPGVRTIEPNHKLALFCKQSDSPYGRAEHECFNIRLWDIDSDDPVEVLQVIAWGRLPIVVILDVSVNSFNLSIFHNGPCFDRLSAWRDELEQTHKKEQKAKEQRRKDIAAAQIS